MLDTVGPELQVVNKSEKSISLQADAFVVLTPDQEKEASSKLLPINFDGLSKVLAYFQNISDSVCLFMHLKVFQYCIEWLIENSSSFKVGFRNHSLLRV